ncbi:hypothetical protein BGX29_011130 [Mortierella sp. GBA35]|nr:hypothetical protein BGX29_011130 [Mortierella sp. GBA35]
MDLRTLRVGRVERQIWQEVEYDCIYDLSAEEQVEMVKIRREEALGQVVVVDGSKEQRAFIPRKLDISMTLTQQELDWKVTLNFWAMLRKNLRLRVLGLDETLTRFMGSVSKRYFIETLAPLQHLVILENDYVPIDLDSVARVLPGLKRFHLDFSTDSNAEALDVLLPWMPNLTTLQVSRLYPWIATEFSMHCPGLKTIQGANVGPIIQDQSGQLHQTSPENGSLIVLIQNCPQLEKIDWIGHTLYDLNWRDDGCDEGPGYDLEADRVVDEALAVHRGEDAQAVLNVKSQQKEVLHRIGTLRHLRTLDLGADFRVRDEDGAEGVDEQNRRLWQEGGIGDEEQDYHPLGNPMPDCLKLSLEMDLEEFAGLKDLEVFGFEGLDHGIGEEELAWIAKRWSKLKVMRGFYGMPRTEEGIERANLGMLMKTLRPDVVHEPSGICVMVP